jgi:uncharacterized protein YjbI with pentapeptide repeats
MSFWIIVAFAVAVLLCSVVPGVYLWWPSRQKASSRTDLGVALMAGAVIAFAVLGVQVLVDDRVRSFAAEREEEAEHRNLELQLALSNDLTGIRLDGQEFDGLHLYGKPLKSASLVGTTLTRSVLSDADLTEAALDGADLSGTVAIGAKLGKALMNDARLPNAILRGADLTGAELERANLIGVDLVGAILKDARLVDADLRGAYLSSANLTNANLSGADLSTAEVDPTTNFADVWFDPHTAWPKGMRPRPRCQKGRTKYCRV